MQKVLFAIALLVFTGCTASVDAPEKAPATPEVVAGECTDTNVPTLIPILEDGATAANAFYLDHCGEKTQFRAYSINNGEHIVYVNPTGERKGDIHLIKIKRPFTDTLLQKNVEFDPSTFAEEGDLSFMGMFADGVGSFTSIFILNTKTKEFINASYVDAFSKKISVTGSSTNEEYSAKTTPFDHPEMDLSNMFTADYKIRVQLPDGTEKIITADEERSGKLKDIAPMLTCAFADPTRENIKEIYAENFPHSVPCWNYSNEVHGYIDLKKQKYIKK